MRAGVICWKCWTHFISGWWAGWFERPGMMWWGWVVLGRVERGYVKHSPPPSHIQSLQSDIMRARISRYSPVKLQAVTAPAVRSKRSAETLREHSIAISNLNWPCDPVKELGQDHFSWCISSAKNKARLCASDLSNNDQMFLSYPFSQFKDKPSHKALSTLESISQLVEGKVKKFNCWLT